MDINEAEPMIQLVKGDVVGLLVDLVSEAEVSLVFEDNGGSRGGGSGQFTQPFLDSLFGSDTVEDILSGLEHVDNGRDGDVCTAEEITRD